MREAVQLSLFDETAPVEQRFEAWVRTGGGNHILRDLYRLAAPYAQRWLRHGRKVSVRLLWETERDRIGYVRARLRRRGVTLRKEGGYALDNNFHALVVRHILAHRPEWAGMFEERERNRPKRPRLAVVLPARRAG